MLVILLCAIPIFFVAVLQPFCKQLAKVSGCGTGTVGCIQAWHREACCQGPACKLRILPLAMRPTLLQESHRMADLMSQLPTSVDVTGEQNAVQHGDSVTMQA